MDGGQRAAQADGEVCTERHSSMNKPAWCRESQALQGITTETLSGWWGEAGGEAGVKRRAKVTKDAASRVAQEPHLCSNSDGKPVKGLRPLVARPDLYLKCLSVGK